MELFLQSYKEKSNYSLKISKHFSWFCWIQIDDKEKRKTKKRSKNDLIYWKRKLHDQNSFCFQPNLHDRILCSLFEPAEKWKAPRIFGKMHHRELF